MNQLVQLKNENGNMYPVSDVYSTKEQIVGTWIDNKPIYRKVINFTFDTDITKDYVIGNIPNFERIIRLEGFFWEAVGWVYKFPFGNEKEYIFVYVKSNGEIYERTNYTFPGGKPAILIVEYTKK